MALPNENKPQNEPFDPWEKAEKGQVSATPPETPRAEAPRAPQREPISPVRKEPVSRPQPPKQEIPQAGDIPLEKEEFSRAPRVPRVPQEPLPKEPPRKEDLSEPYYPPKREEAPQKSQPRFQPKDTPKKDFRFTGKSGMEEDYFGVAGQKEKRPEVPWGETLPKQKTEAKAPVTPALGKELPKGKPLEAKPKKKRKVFKEILKFVGIFAVVFAIIFVILNWPSIAVNLKYWWEQNRGGEDSTAEESVDLSIEDPGGIPSDDRIRISKIKVNAPIIFSKDPSDKALLEDLKKGVVHYPGTAMPGETGNCFITGHSSNYWWINSEYNTVFTLLPKLVVGDKIVLYYKQQKFIYEVKETFEVSPGETEVLNPTDEPTLTLMTCVPIGTNLRRLIIKTDQISPAPGENTDLNRPRLPGE
ncbi:sortase [Patescibacteria group bacterium]